MPDVENIPCVDNSFSVVQCRSAFHHMENSIQVFREMLRFCEPNGRLAVQDIIAYRDPKVNAFFEALEKNIDISHNSTLHKQEFIDLFDQNQVEVIRSFVVEIELNFHEYLGHAHQSERSLAKIKELLEDGLRDREISRFLYMNKEMELVIKRSVFLILGRKRRSSSMTLSRTSAGSYIPGHK